MPTKLRCSISLLGIREPSDSIALPGRVTKTLKKGRSAEIREKTFSLLKFSENDPQKQFGMQRQIQKVQDLNLPLILVSFLL